MPFDWMQSKVNENFARKIANRFEEGFLVEIEQRAHLLLNLHYTKKEAISRISDNIRWEFELSELPAFAKNIKSIVDRVYKRKAS